MLYDVFILLLLTKATNAIVAFLFKQKFNLKAYNKCLEMLKIGYVMIA